MLMVTPTFQGSVVVTVSSSKTYIEIARMQQVHNTSLSESASFGLLNGYLSGLMTHGGTVCWVDAMIETLE